MKLNKKILTTSIAVFVLCSIVAVTALLSSADKGYEVKDAVATTQNTPEITTEAQSTVVATLPITTIQKTTKNITTTANKTTVTTKKTTVAKTREEKTTVAETTVAKTIEAEIMATKVEIPETILLPNEKKIKIFLDEYRSNTGVLAEKFLMYTTENKDTITFDKETNRLLSVSFSHKTYLDFPKIAEKDRKGFAQKFIKNFCNPEDYSVLKREGNEQTPIYTFIKQYQGVDSSNRYSVSFNQEGYMISFNLPKAYLFTNTEPFEKADVQKCDALFKEAMINKGYSEDVYTIKEKVFAVIDGEYIIRYFYYLKHTTSSGQEYFTHESEDIPL